MAISAPLLSNALKVDITYRIGFFSACMAFSAAFTAALHSRHLMVWAIFAPKYIFTATIVIVIDVAFLLCMMCLSSGGERDEGKKKM